MARDARRRASGNPQRVRQRRPLRLMAPVQCLALMASGATGMAERY